MRSLHAFAFSLMVLGTSVSRAAAAGSAPDFYSPASLTVTIEPPEAASQARWQVSSEMDPDGNWIRSDLRWRATGHTETDLWPGRHAVVFQAPFGWVEPRPIEIVAAGGAELNRTVRFHEVPAYPAGEIPPLTVSHGETLSLFVLGDVASVDFEPHAALQRQISFQAGMFTYMPSEKEREQFRVTFTGALGKTTDVIVTPTPRYAAEQSVLMYQGELPDLESRSYIHVSVEPSGAAELFNNKTRIVRSVTVSGPTVVFEKGHENQVYDLFAYTPTTLVDDVKELNVFADEVVFRGAARFPQTSVTIHSREVRFEDAGADTGSLSTTPLKKDGKGSKNGTHGLTAGTITLEVAAVYAPGSSRRFILKGGDGQDPGDGANGGAGSSYQAWDAGGRSAIRVEQYTKWAGVVVAQRIDGVGANTCPTSGGNATAAGVPGDGGAGGELRAPFDLTAIADLSGGRGGSQGPYYAGGAAGTPRNAVHAKRICYQDVLGNITGCDDWTYPKTCAQTEAGSGIQSPAAARTTGISGAHEVMPPSLAWMHPAGMRALLRYARDAYLNGRLDAVRGILEPYGAAVEGAAAFADADLEQARGEVSTLLHRLESHLDYFGYPAGWVPMLSFEVTRQLFEDEVAAAGDILYVVYYLSEKAMQVEQRARAIQRAQAELSRESEVFSGELKSTQEALKTLESQAQALDREIAYLRQLLGTREETLELQARWTAGLKKAFRVTGTILTMVPVYQPALGIAGAALTTASKFNEAPPKSLAAEVVASQFPAAVEAFLIDHEGGGSEESDVKKLQEKLQWIQAGVTGVQAVIQEAHGWEGDVDAELHILTAADPDSNELVKDIQDLNLKKRRFAEDMARTVQTTMDLMTGIAQNRLALRSLSRESVAVQGKIDQDAFQYLKEMEQRAKDRLLKYQYYLAKAFEYRTVRPFVGDFQLGSIYEFFASNFTDDIPSQAGAGILNPRSMTAAYEEELRAITEAIVTDLQEKAPEQTLPVAYTLSPTEIEQLNSPPYTLRLNLVEKGTGFSQTQENLRIFELGVKDMRASPGSGGQAADVSILVQHSGESLIEHEGETYKFNHYKTLETPPITWEAVYVGPTGEWTNSKPSAGSNSLLESLLGQDADDDLILYSRPAAWADLVVTKETLSDDVDMIVESLTIEIQYDYSRKRQGQANLEVKAMNLASEELAPSLVVRNPDRNGRGDGRGTVRRTYRAGEQVFLEAAPSYGSHAFQKWVDRQGNPVGTSPAIAVDLPNPANGAATVSKYRAIYDLGSPSPGEPHFRRGDSNADDLVNISDAISILSFLFSGGSTPGCTKSTDLDDDGRVNITDPIFLLSFLFSGGREPPAPFNACGVDGIPDLLTCASFLPCP